MLWLCEVREGECGVLHGKNLRTVFLPCSLKMAWLQLLAFLTFLHQDLNSEERESDWSVLTTCPLWEGSRGSSDLQPDQSHMKERRLVLQRPTKESPSVA